MVHYLAIGKGWPNRENGRRKMSDWKRPTIDYSNEAHLNFTKYMDLAKMARRNAEQMGRAGRPWNVRADAATANAIGFASI